MRRFLCGLAWLLCLGSMLLSNVAAAQTYQEEDPIPEGARGQVLPVSGQVLELHRQVL